MHEVFDDLQVTFTGGAGLFVVFVVGVGGVDRRAGVAVVVSVLPVPGGGGEYLPYGFCLGVNGGGCRLMFPQPPPWRSTPPALSSVKSFDMYSLHSP